MVRSKSLFGEVIDAAHDRDAGVVDENVDRAERGGDLFDHRRHGRRLETSAGTAMARPPLALMRATIVSASSARSR